MSDEKNSIITADVIFPVPIDDYSDLALSDNAKKQIFNVLVNAKSGLVSITPIICKGPDSCPFISRCPIYMADGVAADYPLNKQCLMEASFIRDKYTEYIQEFNLQGEIENSPTLKSLMSKLAELDLYDYRLSLILAGAGRNLSSDGSLLIEQTIAITEDEERITQLQEHPAWKMKERVQKQRMDLLDAIIATPKRKVWKQVSKKEKSSDDYLSHGKQLLEKLDMLTDAITEKEKE